MTGPKVPSAGPLSHSSAKTMLGCEQKYWHYKVRKTTKDSDYEKSDALAVGSAFHYIQEIGRHKKIDNMTHALDHCCGDEDIQLKAEHRPLVHAMCVKYWRLHAKSKFLVLEIEFALKSPTVIGYVDAIMQDPDGKWWIVDLKTARSLYGGSVTGLAHDPQLNLYASFVNEIADMFQLDEDSFGGCRWRVATKPTTKRKAVETDLEYTKRLLKSVKSYDIEVPVEDMDPAAFRKRHEEYWKTSNKLFKPRAKPNKNYGNCFSFFRPCEYWSKCHGDKIFSDTNLKIIEEV